MPANPDDFICYAKSINTHGNNEIECRVAASRAYYGAYHACSILASKLKYKPKISTHTNFKHEELSKILENHKNKSTIFNSSTKLTKKEILVRKLGYFLKQCKDIRVKSDYYLLQNFDINDSNDAIQFADQIINICKTLP